MDKQLLPAQWATAVEYANGISAGGVIPPIECPVYDTKLPDSEAPVWEFR